MPGFSGFFAWRIFRNIGRDVELFHLIPFFIRVCHVTLCIHAVGFCGIDLCDGDKRVGRDAADRW